MRKKLTICFAALLTIVAGATSLSSPATAAEAAPAEMFGCSTEDFSEAVGDAHDACQEAGYDSGTVTHCNDDGTWVAECWNL